MPNNYDTIIPDLLIRLRNGEVFDRSRLLDLVRYHKLIGENAPLVYLRTHLLKPEKGVESVRADEDGKDLIYYWSHLSRSPKVREGLIKVRQEIYGRRKKGYENYPGVICIPKKRVCYWRDDRENEEQEDLRKYGPDSLYFGKRER